MTILPRITHVNTFFYISFLYIHFTEGTDLITIQAMSPKKFSQVNGFKAPEEWYAVVQRIADERGTTVGSAIQYVFNLGLPIYEQVRKREMEVIAEAHEVYATKDPPPQKSKGASSA